MEWIGSPLEIAHQFDGYIFDIFGVLHDGTHAHDEVIGWLLALKEQKKKIGLISNSPLVPEQVKHTLEGFGIESAYYNDTLLTAGQEARYFLETYAPGKKCFFVGSEQMAAALVPPTMTLVDALSKAHLIVFAGPDPAVKNRDFYDDLLQEALALKLPLVCANPDVSVYVGREVALRAGLFAQRYEDLGGHVTYHGKPHPSIYMRLAQQWAPIRPERILCIGDSFVTDVIGATFQGHASLLIAGYLCLQELGIEVPEGTPQSRLREKISAHIEKGPYNPTYGLFLS
ncbi:MAG: TIGR01459 family HAD-type hydrolase [Candidatus Puniceispirillum sp.]|nr:TIGR01459 family HAD-type hydrolase [Candidatus Puniceispirillum sp.]